MRVAHKTKNPEVNFAVKSIRRESFETEKASEGEIIQELMILLSVDHPNIVKLYEIYLDHKYLHLVTELLEGGPISPESMPSKRYSEFEAAKIIR